MKSRNWLQAMEEDTHKWARTMGALSACHIFIRFWYKEWNLVMSGAITMGFIILAIMVIITIKLRRKNQ